MEPSRAWLLQRARQLRRDQTSAEATLWYHLRGRALCSYKFRRQHIIGPLIVDFVCLPRKLVVEVDGPSHTEPRDRERDQFLRSSGYHMIHIGNEEVYENLDGDLEGILQALEDYPSPA